VLGYGCIVEEDAIVLNMSVEGRKRERDVVKNVIT